MKVPQQWDEWLPLPVLTTPGALGGAGRCEHHTASGAGGSVVAED